MERITHDGLAQGSDEWKKHRRSHKNASEAAAMLGLSSHTTRNEMVRMYATGDEKEFSDYVQKYVLDHGHEVEAAARPIAEEFVGEGLYPSIFSLGAYSCSTDGLSMDEAFAWEHKQWSETLAASVSENMLPPMHMPQCQQVMMVTGAKRCLFTVSDGTADKCAHMWVDADEEWFNKIRAGWTQFDEDIDNYQHVEADPVVVGKAPETLPALHIEVKGMVTDSNLVAFKETSMAVLGSINTDLQTDTDFANAAKTVKWCSDVEERLDAAKSHALSQTASIDELFRAIDEIKEEARSKRLELNKLVTTRKAAIRSQILQDGKTAFDAYIASLNTRLGNAYMPIVPIDLAGVMSGKKTVDSLNNAVDTEISRGKIEANAIADKIQINVTSLKDMASDYKGLFPDTRVIVLKDNDDLVAVIKSRISEHKEEEQRKADEAEAKRLRDEENKDSENKASVTSQPVSESCIPEGVETHSHQNSASGSISGMNEKDIDATENAIRASIIDNGIGKQVAKKIAGLLIDNKIDNVSVDFMTKS